MMSGITHFLTNWCLELPKPLIVFIDAVDSLMGDSLLTVLRQLRAGYERRPKDFPHSLCLIGLRDIRDYRIYSDREKRYVIGGSCFNIKEKALTLANFTLNQIIELFKQHTDETGQEIEIDALTCIFDLTQGQPWIVNAFGRELCFDDHAVEWNKWAYVQFRGSEFHTRNARSRQPQEQRRAKAHSRQAKLDRLKLFSRLGLKHQAIICRP